MDAYWVQDTMLVPTLQKLLFSYRGSNYSVYIRLTIKVVYGVGKYSWPAVLKVVSEPVASVSFENLLEVSAFRSNIKIRNFESGD